MNYPKFADSHPARHLLLLQCLNLYVRKELRQRPVLHQEVIKQLKCQGLVLLVAYNQTYTERRRRLPLTRTLQANRFVVLKFLNYPKSADNYPDRYLLLLLVLYLFFRKKLHQRPVLHQGVMRRLKCQKFLLPIAYNQTQMERRRHLPLTGSLPLNRSLVLESQKLVCPYRTLIHVLEILDTYIPDGQGERAHYSYH